jgi:methyl-accepting chemotaxis protein
MSYFNNLKIGTRLIFAFAVMSGLIVVLGGLTLAKVSTISTDVGDIATRRLPNLNAVIRINEATATISKSVRDMVLFSKPDDQRRFREANTAARKRSNDAYDVLDKGIAGEESKSLLGRMLEARTRYREQADRVIALVDQGKKDEATTVLESAMTPAQNNYETVLEAMKTLQDDRAATASNMVIEAGQDVRATVVVTAAIALLVAVAMSILIIRSITKPLNRALTVAQRVAAGDLTSVVEVDSKDEVGQLMLALREMNTSLARMVGEVRSGTDSIATASKEIAAGNVDLSQRTEEQASSLEETASSMEELTSTVKQNAENAKQANQLAAGASAVAVRGGMVVGQVVTTMSSINDSSKKIVDIISVIDGIAFQTNILALNAAVEAARAGEQGRGFAVVASEVRTLAQRSAAAAKEIKGLISDSVDKVEDGTRLVDEAGKTMDEIVTSVKRVTDIMAEITAASQEQSQGISQVNTAVTQMDEVTQQNAALVEQAAAAAESLQEQAEGLSRAVSVFQITDQQPVFAPAVATVRPKAQVRPAAARTKAPAARKESRVMATAGAEDDWNEF